jgi:hypothetical protein
VLVYKYKLQNEEEFHWNLILFLFIPILITSSIALII